MPSDEKVKTVIEKVMRRGYKPLTRDIATSITISYELLDELRKLKKYPLLRYEEVLWFLLYFYRSQVEDTKAQIREILGGREVGVEVV